MGVGDNDRGESTCGGQYVCADGEVGCVVVGGQNAV